MTDAAMPIAPQSGRKQRNDRLVRRLTTAATTIAIGLAGAFTGLATAASTRSPALAQTEPSSPSADAVLAAAIADYAAAMAPRQAVGPTPARSHPSLAPAPPRAPARPRAVVVSGGS